MRLRDILNLLEKNVKKFQITAAEQGGLMKIENYVSTLEAVTSLERLDFIKDEINTIKQNKTIFNSRLEYILVHREVYNNFMPAYSLIVTKCNTAIEAIRQSLPEQDPNSISVKLPKINNLSELVKFFSDLDKALN
ncbi:hypothetical protein ACJDU8_15650 [Clostridium sp. WILCCON 0269]|uniref:Uncharacterized protein n=1 Tax=Candidatus Clostridium eludens TaxID=3381663 RepID=A0ABW8SMT6_9CLOT